MRQRWDKSFVVRSANEPAGRHRDLASELRWSTCSLVPRAEIFEPTRSSSARRCGLYSPSPWPPTHQGDGQGGRVQGRSAQPSTRELDWRQVAVIVIIVGSYARCYAGARCRAGPAARVLPRRRLAMGQGDVGNPVTNPDEIATAELDTNKVRGRHGSSVMLRCSSRPVLQLTCSSERGPS